MSQQNATGARRRRWRRRTARYRCPGFAIAAIGLYEGGWLPPKWDWVDPLKDARAEIAADRAREQSLGLSFGSTEGVIADPSDNDPTQEGPPS